MDATRGESKGNGLLSADELLALLRTNTRPIPSHSPFPTAKPLVNSPTWSVLEEKAGHWFANTLIAFWEPSILGSPPKGRNFGTKGDITRDRAEHGGCSPRDWTSSSLANRLEERWAPTPEEAARVLKSLTPMILCFLGDVLERVELQEKVSVPSEDESGVISTESPKVIRALTEGFQRYSDHLFGGGLRCHGRTIIWAAENWFK